MADIIITEFVRMANGERSYLDVGEAPALANQLVTIVPATSTPSAVLNPATRFVRVFAESACSILVGSGTPVVSKANGIRMAAGSSLYLGIEKSLHASPGAKIAVID